MHFTRDVEVPLPHSTRNQKRLTKLVVRKTGKRFTIILPRPNKNEGEAQIHLNTHGLHPSMVKLFCSAVAHGCELEVLAVDTQKNVMYARGNFHVTRELRGGRYVLQRVESRNSEDDTGDSLSLSSDDDDEGDDNTTSTATAGLRLLVEACQASAVVAESSPKFTSFFESSPPALQPQQGGSQKRKQLPTTWGKEQNHPQGQQPVKRVHTEVVQSHIRPSWKDGGNNTSMRRATPTLFLGIKFRSRLEARSADLMNRLGVPYLYEAMKLKLETGNWYTPDFWLPNQKLAIEIKPCYPHVEELAKCEDVSRSGLKITLMYGNPGLPPHGFEHPGGRTYNHSLGMRGIAWENGHRLPGDTMWVQEQENGEITLQQVTQSSDMRWDTSTIRGAVEKVPTH